MFPVDIALRASCAGLFFLHLTQATFAALNPCVAASGAHDVSTVCVRTPVIDHHAVYMADSDNFYDFQYDDSTQPAQEYRHNSDGSTTNFSPEYHPSEEGWSVDLRREWVQTPGARTGLEDNSTGIQFELRF
jgi:hypothetical protein